MPDYVGQGFLQDAVGRHVGGRRQRASRTCYLHLGGDPGQSRVRYELVEIGQAGRRAQLGGLVGRIPQHADQEPHLVQGPAGGGFDDRQGGPGLGRVRVDHHPGYAGTHGDHAHRVGDDVVQVPRDLGSLFSEGPADLLGAFGGGRRERAGRPGRLAGWRISGWP